MITKPSSNSRCICCEHIGDNGPCPIEGHTQKYVVYLDRLPYDKIEKLRAAVGTGELGWEGAFPKLPPAKKLEVGQIAFDCKVKNVTMKFERNVSNGFNTPIIIAEPA